MLVTATTTTSLTRNVYVKFLGEIETDRQRQITGIGEATIQKLQRVQNSAARIVLQAPRRSHTKPLLRQLHWLPVQHRITYKLALLTYKVRTTSTPAYLSRHIKLRDNVRTLRSTPRPLDCPKRSPIQLLPSVLSAVPLRPPGTLLRTVTDSNSLGTFKSRLKTFLYL